MKDDDQGRSVVASLGTGVASALSVRAAAQRLLDEQSWPVRLALLGSDPRLVDESLAQWFVEQGDELLARLVVRAVEVGVHAAGAELPAALALENVLAGATDDVAEAVSVVLDGCARVGAGADWIWPLVGQVVGVVVTRIRSDPGPGGLDGERVAQLAQVRAAIEPLLVRAAGSTPAAVAQAHTLALQEWVEVWAALPTVTNVADIATACVALWPLAVWFEADPWVAGWVEDLQNVLRATMQRGVDAAVQEHRLALMARDAPTIDRVPEGERADYCAAVAGECFDYFQGTGATWVLEAALEPAHAAYQLTPEGHPDRAMYASNLGSLLTEAVVAGVLEPGVLGEAVEYQREAYQLTGPNHPNHPNHARYASNLGSRLADAVHAGVLEPGVLGEAVDYQREAYQLTGPTHPDRARRASSLGSLLGNAAQAGVLEPGMLGEAVEYQREAYQLTGPNHPNHARYASSLGDRLAQAVQAGVLEPKVLGEAVRYQREAYQLTGPNHPDRAMYAANLGNLLADAVQAGVLEPKMLGEAVHYQREAHQITGPNHPNRAGCASGLGARLAQAVQAGVLEPKVLGEAVHYQREAYELTGPNHPDRAMYAANLGNLLAQGVHAGVLEPGVLGEAVEYQREAYKLTGPNHPDRARCASSLGGRLSEAVQAGVLEPGVLGEAMYYQREAYQLTGPNHPSRAVYASSLGNLLAEAVQAGVLEPKVLGEAMYYQREAYQLTGPNHPDRAMYAANLGNLLAEAVQAGVLEPKVLGEAVHYQREAYQLTGPNHPDRARYASNLGRLLAEAVQAGQAGVLEPEVLGEVSGLLDEVWRLARRGVTLTHRRQVLAAARGMSARLPLVLLRNSGPVEAVRAVEALRGHLTGGMHAPLLRPGSVEPGVETTYRQAASAYEAAQARAREGLAGYADATASAVHLAEVVDRIRASTPSLSGFGGRPLFADLCAGLPEHAAGIYLLPAPPPAAPTQLQGPGVAVIVRRDGRTGQVPLPGLTSAAVRENASALLTSKAAAQRVCAWLWDTVAAPLMNHDDPLLTGTTEWVIVPSGHLGLVPLHAAGTQDTGWLDDHVTVRVTPSLLALADIDTPVTPSGSPILAISDATDLAFLTADRAVTQAFIHDVHPVADPVTADSALEALAEAPAAVICGHATHSLDHGGALDFGATENTATTAAVPARWLTAEAVERLPLRDRQWVFLSSCSSGQTATDLPDEAIGLPSAFRHAGFRTVIATTWPVKDHIAFITLARYLQHRQTQPQDTASTAIRRTRAWLRTATRDDLVTWLNNLTTTASIPPDNAARLRQWWTNCPDATPYADPQDWAPYAATGH